MSFYVTLPSTASMDVYPDNTSSNYSTIFPSSIPLDGSWQVGLAGFSYRQSISSVIGRIVIYKKNKNMCGSCWVLYDAFDVICYEGETYGELMDRINLKFTDVRGDRFKFETASDPFIVFSCPDNYLIKMSGVLTAILRVPKEVQAGQIATGYYPKTKINRNEFFFFYTDIIVDQYVGDAKVKLLDTMSLQGVKGESVTVAINNPHYVDLAVTELTSININIKDSLGENIHFDNLSRVIVKLHFRPQNE